MLDREQLMQRLYYDPETGLFTYRVTVGGRAREGMVAGCKDKEGYIVIGFNRRLYFAHRLAWLYVHGEWPSMLDHANRDKADNRIKNLRLATGSQDEAAARWGEFASSL